MAKASIAGIAVRGRLVLVARRTPGGQMGGRWEFPGGKVETGEDDAAAVRREFMEEFGIAVEVGQFITAATFEHDGAPVALHAYRITVPHDGGEVPYLLNEHTEYRWADVDEVPSLSFVDSDLLLYPAVRRYVLGHAE